MPVTIGGTGAWHLLPRWQVAALTALLALAAWIVWHGCYRTLTDTPRASLGTAPQGYTRIAGTGCIPEHDGLTSPLQRLPCLWYRTLVERRVKRGWRICSEEISADSICIEQQDGSRCYLDPRGALVEASARHVERDGSKRITEWRLAPGRCIEAIGHFFTRTALADRCAYEDEVRDRVLEWKASGHTMEFDLDGDGSLSTQEWMLVRAAAQREVGSERQELAKQADDHCMAAPSDGRHYFITDLDIDQLAGRYRIGACAWLLLFFAMIAATWLRWKNP